jgi:hypothetical protein
MADKITLGSGMAEKARQALASREYQLHVKQAQAEGDTPMTPEEWAAQKDAEQTAANKEFNAGFAKGRGG